MKHLLEGIYIYLFIEIFEHWSSSSSLGTTVAEAMSGCKPGNNSAVLQYLNSAVEKDQVNSLRDYMRRVLPTLPVDSDNEGYD